MKHALLKATSAILSFLIIMTSLLFLLQIFQTPLFAADDNYKCDFDETYEDMLSSGFWVTETARGGIGHDLKAPTIIDGAMELTSGESVHFLWTKLIGEDNYSPSDTYHFEFEATVTDAGCGTYISNPERTRVLYVSFGGWYNQIELNNRSGVVRAGENYNLPYNDDTFLEETVHIKVTLEGNVITSAILDAQGNVLTSGSRTSSNYSNLSADQGSMKYFNLRCEDGGVAIRNFRFYTSAVTVTDSQTLDIAEDEQAIYFNTIEHVAGMTTSIKLGGTELFFLSDEGMRICASKVNGIYPAGAYAITAYINPAQKMVLVTVTLPDGGILRRGTASVLGGNIISVSSGEPDNIGTGTLVYEDIDLNEYTLMNTEPARVGFEQNVYNIVSSFEDACTTRLFAWTAKASFIGEHDMALQYRAAGTADWNTVVARKQAEYTSLASEDYFKADLTDLIPDTTYEYRIGKKDITADGDWSDVYTFRTAPEALEAFSFIAIGDSQGMSWNGDTTGNKGYKYTMAAIQEAMKELPNPAFIFHTGDVSETGSDTSHWNWYFKALSTYGTSIPHFATIGNHDTWISDQNNYFSLYFNHPDNGDDAMDPTIAEQVSTSYAKLQVSNYEDTIYSYDYGDVHFIVLHSGVYNTDDDAYIQRSQRDWLEADLKAHADAKWTVVMTHEAIYHRKGGSESRLYWNDLLEQYGVDLVIQGHSHLVTRTYPMKNGTIVTKQSTDEIEQGIGTVYTTIGSTTLNHDSIGDPNIEECMLIVMPDNLQPAYTVVSVEGDLLSITTKQINGLVLDTFSIIAKQQDTTDPDANKDTDDITGNTTDDDKTPDDTTSPGGCNSTLCVSAMALIALLPLGVAITPKRKK